MNTVNNFTHIIILSHILLSHILSGNDKNKKVLLRKSRKVIKIENGFEPVVYLINRLTIDEGW